MALTWEVKAELLGSDELAALLADNWQPFGATTIDGQPAVTVRRQVWTEDNEPRSSTNVTDPQVD